MTKGKIRPGAAGRPRKYPWEKWFKHRRFTLRRGVEYDCAQSTMVQAVRSTAYRMGKYVSVVDGGDHVICIVQNGRQKK